MARATYTGYDAEGNLVIRQKAADANDYLNPNSVLNVVGNAQDTIREQFRILIERLDQIATDADLALVVNTLKVNKAVEEFSEALSTLVTPLCENIDTFYQEAVSKNAELQDSLNSNARAAVSQYPGVVSVR